MGARVHGTCVTKKLRYPNEVEAMIALAGAQRKRERRGDAKVEKRYYVCGLCRGGYHLTHLAEDEVAPHVLAKQRAEGR